MGWMTSSGADCSSSNQPTAPWAEAPPNRLGRAASAKEVGGVTGAGPARTHSLARHAPYTQTPRNECRTTSLAVPGFNEGLSFVTFFPFTTTCFNSPG